MSRESSREWSRERGYKEGREGKPSRPPRGVVDTILDKEGANEDNAAYRQGHQGGKIDREQGR